MSAKQQHSIGRHRVSIAVEGDVWPPSPYSLFLAEHLPPMPGADVVDIGTGSGLLAIVALLQGARRVRITDTNAAAISVAVRNAAENGVGDGIENLPVKDGVMIPLAPGERVDVIISNPAQLPLPSSAGANAAYYAGEDGRSMIEAIIDEAPERLATGGKLLMTHNSLANIHKTRDRLAASGLTVVTLGEKTIAFRPFVNRAWLDEIGGVAAGLYSEHAGEPFETLYVIEATRV